MANPGEIWNIAAVNRNSQEEHRGNNLSRDTQDSMTQVSEKIEGELNIFVSRVQQCSEWVSGHNVETAQVFSEIKSSGAIWNRSEDMPDL